MEKICASIKGIYRDVLKDRDNRIIFDGGWRSNLIVNGCRTLLAAFMKNDQTRQVLGITSLRVGPGESSWDVSGAPAPTADLNGLVEASDEPDIFNVDVGNLEIRFLDENDTEVLFPTNRLQISAALGVNEPPLDTGQTAYPLREFGLFGQYVEGGVVTDYMIDCIRHPVIHKDANTTLLRVVRLYF